LARINLNYGIWLNNRHQVTDEYEAPNRDNYLITSQDSFTDKKWDNSILTF